LAPDFWLSHSFDRTGVTSKQVFELSVPCSVQIQLSVRPDIPSPEIGDVREENEARRVYRWNTSSLPDADSQASQLDIELTTVLSWDALAKKMALALRPDNSKISGSWKKASELTGSHSTQARKVRAVYYFVSKRVSAVDLPLGATGFRTREPAEILASGYATSEDKFALLSSLT